jgi:deoxyribonucleoside regulator
MPEDDLLYQVAKLYYEQRRTQLEISKTLKTSRSTVSRLLQRAVDQEVVVIRIRYPWRRNADLEQRLKSRLKLLEVRVLDVEDRSAEKLLAGTGFLAARLFNQYVKDDDIVGVSYGRAVANTAAALTPGRHVRLTVVPVIGALGAGNNAIDGPELVRQFAQAYQGEYHYLPGPLLVKDERTRDVLLRLPQISETLELAKRANIVVIGIGDPLEASPIWGGYLDKRGIDWVISRGAIGHMCGQFFDESGEMLQISTNKRSIGIGLKSLRTIERVIAVASGKHKAAAIRGAVRGKLFNMLVTDRAAAQALLELE